MMEEVPKKQALMDIIKAMKGLKIEKMRGYASKDDDDKNPSMEVEIGETDKDKDPLEQAMGQDELKEKDEEKD